MQGIFYLVLLHFQNNFGPFQVVLDQLKLFWNSSNCFGTGPNKLSIWTRYKTVIFNFYFYFYNHLSWTCPKQFGTMLNNFDVSKIVLELKKDKEFVFIIYLLPHRSDPWRLIPSFVCSAGRCNMKRILNQIIQRYVAYKKKKTLLSSLSF